MAENETATYETEADAGEGDAGAYKLWTSALDLATKSEGDWRKRAKAAFEKYRDEKKEHGNDAGFNILYSSVQTQEPAIYNSTPVPDVRRRYNDDDPTGKVVAQIFERSLSHCIDDGSFDTSMEAVVHDNLLPGRGVAEVIYEPVMGDDETVAYESVGLDHCQWDDFRHGPGKKWGDVPWVARRYRITREEATKLSPKNGPTVTLDHVESNDDKEAKDVPDVFKRLTVWKIWDKSKRQINFLAPSFKEGLFAVEDDILNLEGFFPFPRPIYDVMDSTSLVPIVPFDMYRAQAEELDVLTRRITALVKVCKWRGIRPSQIEELDRLADAEDGDLIPSETAATVMAAAQGAGLDKMIWIMPIERLIIVIRELVAQRDQVKQVVFEISGLADIMRGESNPNETLGAQQIKAQWGSMRMQRRQREVQRFARDAVRMMAEIVGEHFSTETLQLVSGMKLPSAEEKAAAQAFAQQNPGAEQQAPPEMVEYLKQPTWDEVRAVMGSDSMRSYRVDIETDSTITADLTRAQQNMGNFVQGLASFSEAVGPGIQAGIIELDVATDILAGFARNFKLGRQAEDALERLGENKKKGPDPAVQAQMQQMQEQMQQLQAEAQQVVQEATQRAEQAEQALAAAQNDSQVKQAELAGKQQDGQRKAEHDGQELQRKAMVDAANVELARDKLELDAQRFEFERQIKEMELAAANDATEREAQAGAQVAATMEAATQVATATAEAAAATGEALSQAAASLAAAAQQMADTAGKPRVAKMITGPGGERMAVSEVVDG